MSEAPTEKRARPAVDLWKQDYTPPAAVEKVQVDSAPGEDASGAFNRNKLVRGPMAAEAETFQPQRRAGRGSSGDPSEIAPPKATRPLGSAPTGATPPARPRPKSGEAPALGAPSDPRSSGPGSGSYALRGRAPLPAEPPPVPEGPLLEPNRRKPTGTFDALANAAAVNATSSAPTSQSSAPPPPAPPGAAPEVQSAVQAANEAAKNRKPLDPSELAQFSGALADFSGPPAQTPVEAPKAALTETTAEEDPQAAAAARANAPVPPAPAVGNMPHYLVTQVLGEPVALSRNQVVRIGRGEDNEIIFPLSQVSRHHAEVRFDPQASAYVIVDRNSINGTFVNGKSVKRRRLADGDRIGIGPFTVVYRVSTGGKSPRAMDETDVIRPGSLAGELSDMPIPDVARFIEALRKTGELTVITAQGDRGMVLFRDGQPVHAEFKVSLGREAAVAVFRLKAGNFRFSVKTIEVAKATITAPLGVLLTEASVSPA